MMWTVRSSPIAPKPHSHRGGFLVSTDAKGEGLESRFSYYGLTTVMCEMGWGRNHLAGSVALAQGNITTMYSYKR